MTQDYKERDDRRVHLTIVPRDGAHIEIVRYDRQGRWYYESGDKRHSLSFFEAVQFGDDRPAVIWHEGLPGGGRFDKQVRLQRALARGLRAGSRR